MGKRRWRSRRDRRHAASLPSVAVPAHEARDGAPPNLSSDARSRLHLLRPCTPCLAIARRLQSRLPIVPSALGGTELLRTEAQCIQRLLREARVVLDDGCLLPLHIHPPFSRRTAATSSHTTKNTGNSTVGTGNNHVGLRHAVVLRPSHHRPQLQMERWRMRAPG